MFLFAKTIDVSGKSLAQVFFTLVVLVLLHAVSRQIIVWIVHRSVHHSRYHSKAEEQKRERTLITIFRTAFEVVIWVIGILIVLSEINVDVAALATGAGLIGVLVGFGAQSTIRDYLAGIFIITENQYRVGDIVRLSAGGTGLGVAGIVEEITIRITRLRDLDGNLHVVRNGEPGVITNLSIEFANVNIDIGVAYSTDIDKVERVINQIGLEQAKDEKWQGDIFEPIQFLRIDEFGPSSMILKSLGKVQPARQWDVAGDFRRRVKTAFDKEGIEIALPQMVVYQPKK